MRGFGRFAVPIVAAVFAIGAMTAPLLAQVGDPEPVPGCGGLRAGPCPCLQANCIGQKSRCRNSVQCCCNPTGSVAGVCQCRLPDACTNTTGEQCQL